MQRSALCRSRRELSNAYFLAKFRFDTAANEPCKVCPLSAHRSPRWRVYGVVLMTTGSAFIPLCVFLLYDMPHLQRNLPIFGGFLTVLGVLSAWPNFRMRAQALLSNCLRSGFNRYLRRQYRCTGIPLTVYWYDMYTGISRTGTKT